MQYHRTLKQMAVATARRLPLQEKFLAVNDVSFTVEQGESVGLMGLNGSGKSTLLKLINGVMRPDDGHRPHAGPDRRPDRDRRRLPPAADRPREPLPQRRDPGHERGRDQAQVRRDRGLRRHRQVHGHPGLALLLGHVRPARLLDRDPRRRRHLPRRRGARGGGPAVQEEVHGEDAGDPPGRAPRSSTSATPPPRCGRCATACWCSSPAT